MNGIHGVINLHKPPGCTSQQAVTRIKRIFGSRKAGHTGTLDPMATGVLLVCLNEATKLSSFLTGMDKRYAARGKLGERTDTYDAEGKVTEQRESSHITPEMVRAALERFSGKIRQLPPMFSAIKVEGEPLYRMARKGIHIDRPEREVHISEISLAGADIPYFDFSVTCSKGTYVRTLCDDIGMNLGTGAHLVSLERTRTGDFDIQDSVTLDELKEDEALTSLIKEARQGGASAPSSGWEALLSYLAQKKYFISCDRALSSLDEALLEEEDVKKIKQGQQVPYYSVREIAAESFVRLKDGAGNLFGIGGISGGKLRVVRLLNL